MEHFLNDYDNTFNILFEKDEYDINYKEDNFQINGKFKPDITKKLFLYANICPQISEEDFWNICMYHNIIQLKYIQHSQCTYTIYMYKELWIGAILCHLFSAEKIYRKKKNNPRISDLTCNKENVRGSAPAAEGGVRGSAEVQKKMSSYY